MSTDITTYEAPLPERMQYAKALSASGLIPQAYRGQPANVLVAIEYGHALGIAPIVALSEINVIQGTPSLSASLMAALARQAGHKVRVTSTAESATCTIIRADDSDYEHTATWDKAKAQAAGLWGKGHWAKDPATMLRWRAISECVRFACSEVLGGIRYTPEEVAEFTALEPQARPQGRSRLAEAIQQHTPPAPTPDPVEDPVGEVHEAEVIEEPSEEPEPATRAQVTALNAAMTDLGITDRDSKLRFLSDQVGHEIGSSKELTKREASFVLDVINGTGEETA